MNKDAKTTAGIIGEQMDERQTEAWILTLPISAAISNGFLQVVNVSTETLKYHEDNQSTTTRLQLSRDRVRDIFTTCGNPFSRVDFDLVNIVTSEVVDDEKIVSDITCVATKGKEVVEDFLCNRKDDVKKVALRTFPSERKTQKVKGVPRTDLLSSEVTALKRIITAQLSYGEEKEKAVAKILTKEILLFPPSIFEHLPQQSTKTSSGWKMRTGNKAVLLNWLRKKGGLSAWPATLKSKETTSATVHIIDLMSKIRSYRPARFETVKSFAERLLLSLLNDLPVGIPEVHIVADRYNGLFGKLTDTGESISLKSACRLQTREREKPPDFRS